MGKLKRLCRKGERPRPDKEDAATKGRPLTREKGNHVRAKKIRRPLGKRRQGVKKGKPFTDDEGREPS